MVLPIKMGDWGFSKLTIQITDVSICTTCTLKHSPQVNNFTIVK